jgi:hypothetical protein
MKDWLQPKSLPGRPTHSHEYIAGCPEIVQLSAVRNVVCNKISRLHSFSDLSAWCVWNNTRVSSDLVSPQHSGSSVSFSDCLLYWLLKQPAASWVLGTALQFVITLECKFTSYISSPIYRASVCELSLNSDSTVLEKRSKQFLPCILRNRKFIIVFKSLPLISVLCQINHHYLLKYCFFKIRPNNPHLRLALAKIILKWIFTKWEGGN